MSLLSTHPFTWNGKEFEIRVTLGEDGRTTAAAFLGDKPALPFTSSVDFETATRFRMTFGMDPVYDPVEGLVRFLEEAIRENHR